MAVSREDLRGWLTRGVNLGATHMIVVCDTFDWEDYPVYVSKDESVHEVYAARCLAEMQNVMEVYNLNWPIEPQLNEHRAFNF